MHGLSVKRGLEPADLDQLARQAAAGDEEAFERLVRQIFGQVYRWALVRVGDPDDAQDVTQRVLVRLHGSLRRWEGRGRFTTWLYRITANESASWLRQVARRLRRLARAGKLETEAHTGPEDLDAQRMMEAVDACFRRLPPRQREIMDLVDFQGFTPGEAAEMLRMNANTVRANLFKARRSVRARLLERYPGAVEATE